ncbi:MAG: amidase domain-containing protein [Elusimicrobiota bacterium]
MNKIKVYSTTIFLLLFLLNNSSFASDRNAEFEYAKRWWNAGPDNDKDGIPDNLEDPAYIYKNYYWGKNCSNFFSQILMAGGQDLSQFRSYLSNSNWMNNENSIINADGMNEFLEFTHWEKTTITKDELAGRKLEDVIKISQYDAIIYGDDETDPYQHVTFIGPGTGDNTGNLGYYAHTTDRGGEKNLNYPFGQYSIANIYHFPTEEEAKQKEGTDYTFYGGGNVYGDGSLEFLNYTPQFALNFMGYILNALGDYQDMAVGDITSGKPGCIYMLRGFCTDAFRNVPTIRDKFSPAWTSNSPNHWAYWVRETVSVGSAASHSPRTYTDEDIWNAVAYITDRAGIYNGLLSAVGYPENGPSKNIGLKYYIKGYVKDSNGIGISDVRVELSGDVEGLYTLTDSSG